MLPDEALLNFSGQKQLVDLCERVACSTEYRAISQYSKHEAFFLSDHAEKPGSVCSARKCLH